MNDGAGDNRGRLRRPGPRRAGVLAAVLAVAAVAAAACGGNSSTSDAGLTAYQKDLVYAQCMRAHGERGFPDPNSQGTFNLNGPKIPMNASLMAKANKVCLPLLPHGGRPTSAQLKQENAQALKFVACMRTHGVPNMPDPTEQNGAPVLQGWDPSSPVFQSAAKACQRFMPNFGAS